MRSCTLVKVDESARKHGLKNRELRYAVRHPFGFQKTLGNPGKRRSRSSAPGMNEARPITSSR